MKKLSIIVATAMLAASFFSCNPMRNVGTAIRKLAPADKYTNQLVSIWTRPVGIDSAKELKANKTYTIEGYKPNGDVVLVDVKSDILKEVLKLPWGKYSVKTVGDLIDGFGFTCNFLGRKGSILTKNEMEAKYDMNDKNQVATLKRDKNTEKYELRSFLPVNVKGRITEEDGGLKIVMQTNTSTASNTVQTINAVPVVTSDTVSNKTVQELINEALKKKQQ